MKKKITAILLTVTMLLSLTACGSKPIETKFSIPENATAVDVMNAIYPFDLPVPEGAEFSKPHRYDGMLDGTNANEIGIVDAALGGFSVLDTLTNGIVYIFKIDTTSDIAKLNPDDTFVIHSYKMEEEYPDCPGVGDFEYTVTAINKEYILAIYETRDRNDRSRTTPPFAIEQDQKVYENFLEI